MVNGLARARVCGVADSLDLFEIQALSKQPVRFVALSDDSAAFFFACAAFYQNRYNWRVDGAAPTDAEWNTINRLIGKAEYEIMNNLVGLIFPHALGVIADMPFLMCDGAVYNRADYPILYAKLDSVYIIDADTFRVPDLRDKFPVGVGASIGIDDTGGEVEHTLTVGEMASHSHTNIPHSHTEVIAIPALADLGTGAPVPSATPAAGVTGAASVTIDNTGGGQPHNNMPPYVGVYWAIIAG